MYDNKYFRKDFYNKTSVIKKFHFHRDKLLKYFTHIAKFVICNVKEKNQYKKKFLKKCEKIGAEFAL